MASSYRTVISSTKGWFANRAHFGLVGANRLNGGAKKNNEVCELL